MNIQQIKSILDSNEGKMFSVTFIKKDGTERTLNGRLGVKSATGAAPTTANIPKYITVYDVVKHDYRNVNVETISSIKMLGAEITINNHV